MFVLSWKIPGSWITNKKMALVTYQGHFFI